MPSWTLALTQPGRELTIAKRLDLYNFPVFLPKILARVCLRGRLTDRLRPAYGRYIWLDTKSRFHELRTAFGIVDFLKSGPIVDLAVNGLMAVAPNGILPTPQIPSRFARGDRIVVRGNGLLTGQHGVFDRMLESEKAIVLVDWFGRLCPIPVLLDDLLAEPKVTPKPAKRKRRRHRRRNRRLDS